MNANEMYDTLLRDFRFVLEKGKPRHMLTASVLAYGRNYPDSVGQALFRLMHEAVQVSVSEEARRIREQLPESWGE